MCHGSLTIIKGGNLDLRHHRKLMGHQGNKRGLELRYTNFLRDILHPSENMGTIGIF